MRAVIPHPYGGHIVMTGFPGLETAFDGAAYSDPVSCTETLAGLRAAGALDLVVLVERQEIEEAGFDLLARTAAEVGLGLQFHPIEDYNAPSEQMYARWLGERAHRAEVLRAGGTLAYTCQHGAGRSGLMACLCLMETGLSADDAMALVRGHFEEAVESTAQEDWLRALGPLR